MDRADEAKKHLDENSQPGLIECMHAIERLRCPYYAIGARMMGRLELIFAISNSET